MIRRKRGNTHGKANFVAGGIVGTLVGVAAKLAWDGIVDRIAGSDVIVMVLLIIAMIMVITVVTRMSRKVDHLAEKASFRIEYYSADDPERLYGFSREVVGRSDADVEIYAVNSYIEAFKESNSQDDEKLQRRYLTEFENRFDTIKYHRLIQVKNGRRDATTTDLGDLLSPAYRDHYRRMASYAKEHPGSRIKIEEVPARLPTSFVVVKDKNSNGGQIIWQMNKHAPEANEPDVERIVGVFLIRDPDALLVPHFLKWFEEIDRGARELTSEMLRSDTAGGASTRSEDNDQPRRTDPRTAQRH